MLRRNFRWARWAMPWWAPMLPSAIAAGFAFLGASITENVRLIAISGLFTALAAASLRRQMLRHQHHHHRMDKQHAVMRDVLRYVFDWDGRTVPPALSDEREQQPGVVVFRPRGAGPRHSRPRSRRHNA